MARRGVAIILTLVGVALFISLAGFAALYLLVGRGPSVPSNATLTIRLGGEFAEVEPTDVFGLLSATGTPTLRGVVENLRKAKVDDRIRAVLIKSTGFSS